MAKKSRNGKYKKYEKIILQLLASQKSDLSSAQIKRALKIPRSSMYDILSKLRYNGHIEWIGEPQDQISMIIITESGKKYLKYLKN